MKQRGYKSDNFWYCRAGRAISKWAAIEKGQCCYCIGFFSIASYLVIALLTLH